VIDGLYGARLAHAFGLADSPTIVSEIQKGHHLAATEIRIDSLNHGLTDPLVANDVYMVGLHLRDLNRYELWSKSGLAYSAPLLSGCSSLHDLSEGPALYFDEPFHAIYFYVPRTALEDIDQLSPNDNAKELNIRAGHGFEDAIIRNIGLSLITYFGGAYQRNRLVVDYLLLALCGHLALNYAGMRQISICRQHGLAPWQQRRAKELMREHVSDGISLAEISDACGLSPSAFVRAFKKSSGITPYQWLLSRRIERAVQLLEEDGLPLVEVAIAAGFADQSHFTRTFGRKMGVSPGAYRRSRSVEMA
jgi:AraC family transcriptional regulator